MYRKYIYQIGISVKVQIINSVGFTDAEVYALSSSNDCNDLLTGGFASTLTSLPSLGPRATSLEHFHLSASLCSSIRILALGPSTLPLSSGVFALLFALHSLLSKPPPFTRALLYSRCPSFGSASLPPSELTFLFK